MNKKTLLSIAGALLAGQTVRTLSKRWEFPDVLHAVGLERQRSRSFESLGLVVLGAAAGAGAALLLAPSSGRETRERLAKSLTELGTAASEAALELGEDLLSAAPQSERENSPHVSSNTRSAV